VPAQQKQNLTGPRRVAIYIRVSKMSDEGLSPDNQRVRCQGWADFNGGQVVEVYEDLDISGRTVEARPSFLRLMADARQGKFDRVCVYNCSRWARDLLQGLTAINELGRYGVDFVSATEGFDTSTPAGVFLLHMMFSGAQYAASEHGTQMRDNRRQAVTEGRWLGGHVPYGYRHDPAHPARLVPDPATAPIVQGIFSSLAAGESLQCVARRLNAQGIISPHGKIWSTAGLRCIADNPVYRGMHRYAGTVYPGAHAPLVSAEAQETAMRALRDRRQCALSRGRPGGYPFSRRLVCGRCGGSYVIMHSSGADPLRLTCRNLRFTGCDAPRLCLGGFGLAFASALAQRAADPAWQAVVRAQVEAHYAAQNKEAHQERATVVADLRQVRTEMQRLRDSVVRALWPVEMIEDKQKELGKREVALARRLAAMEHLDADKKQDLETVDVALLTLQSLSRWPEWTREEQIDVVNLTVSGGTVYDDRVELLLALPRFGAPLIFCPVNPGAKTMSFC
jgi:DNA invertase Pin-like site-specific DNA recombinase